MLLHPMRFVLWCTARLPLPLNHALGSFIGRLNWWLHGQSRRNTLINLSLCFPELSVNEREKLAKSSLIESGKAMTELGWLWARPKQDLQKLVGKVYGEEHLQAARQSNKGLLVISPHMGAWELCLLALSQENNPITLYRPPRHLSIEPILIAGRTRFGLDVAPLTLKGIRSVRQALENDRAIGILPDQEPALNNGVFAPFFGVQANTMTLLSRLARKSNAGMVFLVARRLPRGRGYEFHYLPASDNIRSANLEQATVALNAGVETCVNLAPDQYIWSYKRFRWQCDGSRRDYKQDIPA